MLSISTFLIRNCLPFLFVTMVSCGDANAPSAQLNMKLMGSNAFELAYDFSTPSQTFVLEGMLDEISGLSYDDSTQHIWAVQDEDGQLFEINIENGTIEGVQTFWKEGDYEGVERSPNGDWVYVVKNTGTIYAFDGDTTLKYRGFMNADFNVEGLGLDVEQQKLLLSCKATPWKKSEDRPIYAFDLEKKVYGKEPLFIIEQEKLRKHILTYQENDVNKFKSFLKGKKAFSCSGISTHPITGHYYIISHTGKMLLILSKDGTIQRLVKLDKKIFEQPEGITFAPDGTLYISNERGDKQAPNLLVFKPK